MIPTAHSTHNPRALTTTTTTTHPIGADEGVVGLGAAVGLHGPGPRLDELLGVEAAEEVEPRDGGEALQTAGAAVGGRGSGVGDVGQLVLVSRSGVCVWCGGRPALGVPGMYHYSRGDVLEVGDGEVEAAGELLAAGRANAASVGHALLLSWVVVVLVWTE
jgi:hypothetical protein